jgi:hypothetical protein
MEHRLRVATPQAKLVAELVVRSREVSHTNSATVYIEDASVRVEQRINYLVRHQPLRELSFELPPELARVASQIEILMLAGGEEGSLGYESGTFVDLLPVADAGDGGENASHFRVLLPQPCIGEIVLTIDYRYVPAEMPVRNTWRVPLIRPVDGQLTAQRAWLHSSPQYAVAMTAPPNGSTWKPETSNDPALAGSPNAFVAQRGELYLPIVSQPRNIDTPSTTMVDRVWLQTWMSKDMRQDRAAFRFRTTSPQVTVELAPHTPEVLDVRLDGEPASVLSRGAGRVVVRVSQKPREEDTNNDATDVPHTLELRYRIPMRFALVTRHALTPPQMVGLTALCETYWHVVLPGDKHVIRSPDQMATASRWQWLNGFWGREPTRTQAELERWAAASTQISPSAAHNQYLYAGVAPVSTIGLVTAPRWLIVLSASAGVLSLVLSCIYFPIMRRRWVLGALGCALAVLAVVFPAPALLLAQASLLGVVSSALAVVLARLVARPSPWRVIVPTSGSARPAASRPDSAGRAPAATAGSTSPTLSLRLPNPE